MTKFTPPANEYTEIKKTMADYIKEDAEAKKIAPPTINTFHRKTSIRPHSLAKNMLGGKNSD